MSLLLGTVRLLVTFLCLLAAQVVGVEFPGTSWTTTTAAEAGLDQRKLAQARDYALNSGGAGLIIRGGKLVLSWGDPKRHYDLKSSTKSFGAGALGLAVLDGKLKLDDPAAKHHPSFAVPPESNRAAGWPGEIRIRQLAAHTAGFDKPGGYQPLLFPPGSTWAYSDCGPNWLAECITLAYRRDVDELMFERIFEPIGIERRDLTWRKNQYRPEFIDGIKRREFGAGISANVNAMARYGLLWLRGGEWSGSRLLPRDLVELARGSDLDVGRLPVHKPEEYGAAAKHYGLLWWNNADEAIEGVPLDTYWSWGLHDSLIVVMPTLDIVVARAGDGWKRTDGADHYDVLKPFFLPIAEAARSAPAVTGSARSILVQPESRHLRDETRNAACSASAKQTALLRDSVRPLPSSPPN